MFTRYVTITTRPRLCKSSNVFGKEVFVLGEVLKSVLPNYITSSSYDFGVLLLDRYVFRQNYPQNTYFYSLGNRYFYL